MQQRASLYTIGCRLNQSETAILSHQLQRIGYQIVPFDAPTDLFILNTCSVTQGAESDCRRVIRRTLQHSPNAFVAVTGCYAQTGTNELEMVAGIDLIVGSQDKLALPNLIPSLRKRARPRVVKRVSRPEDFVIDGVGDFDTTRATLKVQDGCNFMCSFCNIPYARGRERSRRIHDILREATSLVERGHKEIVLSGVNIGRYQSGGRSLLDVIQALEAIPGLVRIRISSIEPTTIPEALIEHMAHSSILCRYLHIPLQSGDDHMLERMNRRYSAREYRAFIEMVSRTIPDVCLGTDVMVGFPGEGDEEFSKTEELVRMLPFAYVHVFSYSARPGTPAAKMDDKVAPRVIRKRSRALRELSRTKRFAFYRRFIGKTVSVLFEERNDTGQWVGLTDTYVRTGVHADEELTNQVKMVKIIGVTDDLAIGELTG